MFNPMDLQSGTKVKVEMDSNQHKHSDLNGGLNLTKLEVIPTKVKKLTCLPSRTAVNLDFDNLFYTVEEGEAKKTKIILNGVSGQLQSGELISIMGHSGAGKSTLLNILSGYKTSNFHGSITMNGRTRNLSSFRKLSAYIMQNVQLHGDLSIREAMMVAANLKLSREITKIEKQNIIREILDILGLEEHCDNFAKNLSGGQKKRLSIALELVNNPPIMFFDEPTSGLDSSTSFQCIRLLKLLAQGGRTIVCAIHQPSARLFEMFDQLYMLADGNCVYQGSTKLLVPYLESLNLKCPSFHNPPAYLIAVTCGEKGNHKKSLVKAIQNGKRNIRTEFDIGVKTLDYNQHILEKPHGISQKDRNMNENLQNDDIVTINDEAESMKALLNDESIKDEYPTPEWYQFWVVMKRTFLFSRRDWTLMYLRLAAHILVGVATGFLYYGIGNNGESVLSNLGFLFFNMIFTMYTSMVIAVVWYPSEIPVLMKENFNQWYSLRSYFFAISVSDIPYQIIFTSIYVTTVYYMSSQPMELFRFGLFFAVLFLVSLIAQSIGIMFGATMSIQNGVFFAPVMSTPFIIFSGFFVQFSNTSVYLRWIPYFSYIRYGFEASVNIVYGFDRPTLKCNEIVCRFKSPETILREIDMANTDLKMCFAALIVMLIFFKACTYFLLKYRLKQKR